ncbi:hypothetical protein DFH08DRAFT_902892 [Mycena albidolilacea]|uniref:Uncharacterized protein n=1 Tax=Mycena albidolilacea TaxID=1033008 RepID=A0AAD7EA80_9AGAR|nr:hypothetical protein DFH08DRAFT_902892 [Mycena albidolilacea]
MSSASDWSFMTLRLDYEPSQVHHEIYMQREAELTEEEHQYGALTRHQKRQQLGHKSSSPLKQEGQDVEEAPQSTAQDAGPKIRQLYRLHGALNSQIGGFTYVDHLLGIQSESGPKFESQLQEPGLSNFFPGSGIGQRLRPQARRLGAAPQRLALRERDNMEGSAINIGKPMNRPTPCAPSFVMTYATGSKQPQLLLHSQNCCNLIVASY